ncbi:MAG: PilZ domain-containing protein [Betaproteobacteria bacterium]|nr:PilZ domain-containing protein [Betaproteobacteria bacterium]
MQDYTLIRKFIRHPSDVHIQVTMDWADDEYDDLNNETLNNVSLGGLSFISKQALEIRQKIKICIPVLETENTLTGSVVWCEKSNNGYEIGLEFDDSKEIFRLRMIEQICHIEHYRKEVERIEGRELSADEAAKEWISRYASDFPAL